MQKYKAFVIIDPTAEKMKDRTFLSKAIESGT